ncbi:MAG: AI-2E family transporter [Bacteroidota bacterium]|nr:AI-2E family transporter [Bacteroidota bacterium]
MTNFFSRRPWKVFVVTFSISAPIFILSLFDQVFYLLVMAFALTMILKPLVDYVEHLQIPRGAAIIGIYIVLAAIISIGLMTVYPIVVAQVSNLSASFDNQHLTAMLSQLGTSISEKIPFLKPEKVAAKLNAVLVDMTAQAERLLTSAISIVASLVIVPFLAFFLLLDYYKMQKAFIEYVPNKYFEMTLNVMHKLEEQISKYIQGTFIESSVVAVLYIISYYIIGVQYATALGIFGGLMNIIPFAGPFIGAVPVVFVSIIQYGDLSKLIPIIISTIVVQQIDQLFVQPTVFRQVMNIHPLIMFVVILIGGQLLGVMGMVLSIPIYTIILVSARETNWGLKNYRITQ